MHGFFILYQWAIKFHLHILIITVNCFQQFQLLLWHLEYLVISPRNVWCPCVQQNLNLFCYCFFFATEKSEVGGKTFFTVYLTTQSLILWLVCIYRCLVVYNVMLLLKVSFLKCNISGVCVHMCVCLCRCPVVHIPLKVNAIHSKSCSL